MGPGRYFKDGSRNILEDFNYDDSFIAFLDYYSQGEFQEASVELILNGDFFNLLQVNYMGVHTYLMTERIVLYGLQQAVNGHSELFEALKRFAKVPGHTLTYIVGNHDQGMLFEKPRRFLSDILSCDIRFFNHDYEFDGIHVEHGHMHEWQSSFDSKAYFITRGLPEPVLNLPWASLFVSEFLPKIKMERSYVDKVKPFSAMIRWMIVNDPWFALKTLGRVGVFVLNTLFLKKRYRARTLKATWNLLKDVTIYPHFDREAERIMHRAPELFAVIMGHTHVLRYRRFREGREYFNIGTWNEATNLQIGNLGTFVSLTYALIEYPEIPPDVDAATTRDKTALKPKIRLKEWKGIWRPEVDAAV